jgi:hypothetical protein
MACAAQLLSAPDLSQAVRAECSRERDSLDCHKTKTNQLVNVLMVYDMTLPERATDKRMLAKVRLKGGDERYAGFAALDF